MNTTRSTARRTRILVPAIVFGLLLSTACLRTVAQTQDLPRVAGVFGHGMVLQRDSALPVWGWAAPGTTVTVTFGDTAAKATTAADQAWRVTLPPQAVSSEPQSLTVTSDAVTIALTNILVGDVWICSGQSNMDWIMRQLRPRTPGTTDPVTVAIDAARFPHLRQGLAAKQRAAQGPLADTECAWQSCTPETVLYFSAVGFFFGRELHRELDIPIGLIKAAWGGTPVEAWTRTEVSAGLPRAAPVLALWEQQRAAFDPLKAEQQNEAKLAAWKEQAAAAKAAGTRLPRRPRKIIDPQLQPRYPGTLYNGMIAPLVPFAVRGVVWYQGEANAGRAHAYQEQFPAMIRDWRAQWERDALPFGFVQLANFQAPNSEPSESAWAELREAQTMALALPRTGMACAIDLGEAGNIHPREKEDVGRRLALWALATEYGRNIPYSGPMYDGMRIEGDRIIIRFQHVGGGLMAADKPLFKPPQETPGAPLRRFQIAGEDRAFVWADAAIENDTVVVRSDAVPRPVAVRYAWSSNPEGCNLYNRAGLPTVPFRTDTWPGITEPQ